MKTRTTAGAFLASVSALALTACGGGSTANVEDSSLPEEISSGITVPFINYAPYSMVDSNGDVIGIDLEIAQALADHFGVELEADSATFEQSLLGVQRGTYAWAPAAEVTEDRKQTYDFVSYLEDHYTLLVENSSPDVGEKPIDMCGMAIGLVTGGTSEKFMREFNKEECKESDGGPIDIKTFPDQNAVVAAVRSGRLDAGAATKTNAAYVVDKQDGLKITGPSFAFQTEGLTLKKGSDLAEPLRDAMNAIIEDGTYASILAKYGVEDTAIEEAQINPDTAS